MSSRMASNDEFRQALIKTLTHIRKERGYSHEMIAKNAGISRQTLGKIESGQTNPTMLTMYKISVAMNIELKTFIETMAEVHKIYNLPPHRI